MDKPYTITVEDQPDSEELEIVRAGVIDFNITRSGADDHRKLSVLLRDKEQTVIGGLLGGTYWEWLYVDYLWVQERTRGLGRGRALLAAAEKETIERGCHHAHPSTHSFQALGFYQKLGYRIADELPDLPAGHSKYWLLKELGQSQMTVEATNFIGNTVDVTVDRPMGSKHSEWRYHYPVNYGYIEGVKAPDGEDLDAYILGVFEPLESFSENCLAVIHRLDDDDDKLVVVADGASYADEQIVALTEFQERFFKSVIIRA